MSEVNDVKLLPPKSYEMWGIIGLFGVSNYLLRTVLGYIAVAMDHENPNVEDHGNHKAIILASFFVGYAANNILAGVAASRFGGMSVLNVACIGWSSCAMLIPTAFDISGGSSQAVGFVMFLLGICCAPMFPASQTVLSYFSTPNTISIGTAIRAAGAHGGSIIATIATPILMAGMDWRSVLQMYGALGLVITIASIVLAPKGANKLKRPVTSALDKSMDSSLTENDALILSGSNTSNQMKRSTSRQKLGVDGIEANVDDNHDEDFENVDKDAAVENAFDWVSICKIVSDSSYQSAVGTHMAMNLSHYTLLSYMPTYFVDVLHLNLSDTAPYLAPSRFVMLIGVVIGGYLSKYVLNNKVFTLTQTRRGGACICLLFDAFALFALPWMETPGAAAVCLCCCTFFIGAFEVFLQSTYIDLTSDAPEYSGFVCGFGNTLGSIPGAAGPFFVSQILAYFDSWVLVFWAISLLVIVSAIVHSQYGSTASISFEKNPKL